MVGDAYSQRTARAALLIISITLPLLHLLDFIYLTLTYLSITDDRTLYLYEMISRRSNAFVFM